MTDEPNLLTDGYETVRARPPLRSTAQAATPDCDDQLFGFCNGAGKGGQDNGSEE
jgi:hypothetical protein